MSTARSQMPASEESPSVSLHDGWLRVHFGAGRGHGDFHLRWLRHNCDLDRHALTSEPTVDSSELPDQLAARAVRVEDDALLVTWAHDQRTSRYRFGWLAEHAYARDRDAVPGPPSDVSAIEIRGRGGEDWSVAQALARVGSHGAAVVRRPAGAVIAPENTTELIIAAFADRGLRVVGTHFGRIEDLRTDNTTNRNTDQLGYTDAAVDPHTDQPFLDEPPLYQLPFERMEEWYRAYDRFARLVRDPRHQYRFRLEPGDYLLYDNYRMLHARTAFHGPRWMRGIYFDA